MDWQDLHVAFMVSQSGTISGAARELGIHHATVMRQVDRLEADLGQKLFRRHAKGYEPTEAGMALFNVAAVANEQFLGARARVENREAGISGKIVVTTLPMVGDYFMPAFERFHALYPDVRIQLEMSARLFRLEYGEAHLALRAGEKPADPDNVVVKLLDLPMRFYSSQSYVDSHGIFDGENLVEHDFVGYSDGAARGPFASWLRAEGQGARIVLDCAHMEAQASAVKAGLGIGMMSVEAAKAQGLVAHWEGREPWWTEIWQVTHRDMHRTPKVEAMAEVLKAFSRAF